MLGLDEVDGYVVSVEAVVLGPDAFVYVGQTEVASDQLDGVFFPAVEDYLEVFNLVVGKAAD